MNIYGYQFIANTCQETVLLPSTVYWHFMIYMCGRLRKSGTAQFTPEYHHVYVSNPPFFLVQCTVSPHGLCRTCGTGVPGGNGCRYAGLTFENNENNENRMFIVNTGLYITVTLVVRVWIKDNPAAINLKIITK